jgi:DNA-binding NtrC family response regulator
MTDGAGRQARVLVVDDDARVWQVIRWALEDEGLAVVTLRAAARQSRGC